MSTTPHRAHVPRWHHVAWLALAMSLASTHVHAQTDPAGGATTGDIVLFPGPLLPLTSPGGPPNKPPLGAQAVGWNMPDRHYRGGAGWWALVCGDQAGKPNACQLQASSLRVDDARHALYDGEPVASQWLRWMPAARNDSLVIVFKPLRSLAKLPLVAGPVTTYLHNGMDDYPRPPGPGTLEVRIPMPNGQHADLVPRVQGLPPNTPEGEPRTSFDVLELRIGDRRQRLPGEWTGCSSGVVRKPMQYLWWAGDLDGDGRLDLIVSHDESQHVTLYLSSLAVDDQLLGEAGRFVFTDPALGEC